ncbi:MAG TPA: aminotransferase class I/II-fold pyridoxal phosphate-dependent enzyme [Myxococcaceae bacterium]|jgi:glycine C-acetyltransferase
MQSVATTSEGAAPNRIHERIRAMWERVSGLKASDHYHFNQPLEDVSGGVAVRTGGREMLMFASYSYLGLLGHPKIGAAAMEAVGRFGTGTHGVRLLAGSLTLHAELERAIARFKHAEDAVTYSSGYATNIAAVTTLVGRHDVVICDKLNHASILDGCMLSGARLVRFEHNRIDDLERVLRALPPTASKLVIADAVFSMDGDILDLPATSHLCRAHGATLMVDEAHSLGVLGARGRGIEEHFGLEGVIDVKMGTLSKAIPSVGGYLAGGRELINLFRHASRPYIFSAALPPAQAAAAMAALEVISEEPERLARLRENTARFMAGLRRAGFDTMRSETAIVPILCGEDEIAYEMVRGCQQRGIFVLPVVSPAVPQGTARLRTTVTAAHTAEQIDRAVDVLAEAGRGLGLV